MDVVSVTEAKAHLNELVDRVETGVSIDITRRGRPVARLTAVVNPRRRIDAAALRSLTDQMPWRASSAVELTRLMRDDDRTDDVLETSRRAAGYSRYGAS